jgi:hypothetical protein
MTTDQTAPAAAWAHDCRLRVAHEPHGDCPGTAPEFPSEKVLTAEEAAQASGVADADPPPVIDRAPLRALIAGGDDLPGVDPGRLERAAQAAGAEERRALADHLAEVSHQITSALAAHAAGRDGQVIDCIRWAREFLEAAEWAVGIVAGPAPAWTLETAPQGSRTIAEFGASEAEWMAIGESRWILLPPHPRAEDPIVRGSAQLADWGGRLTLVPVDAAHASGSASPERVDVLHREIARWRDEANKETRRAEEWRAAAGSAMRRVDELEAAQASTAEPDAEPAAEAESVLVDVDPDSPAGQIAAQLADQFGEHLFQVGGARFSQGRHDGALIAGVSVLGDQLGHLRAIAEALPGAEASAFYGASGTLYVTVEAVRDGTVARITTAFTPPEAQQSAARAWLAELGVEVRS